MVRAYISYSVTQLGDHQRATGRKEKLNTPVETITTKVKIDGSKSYRARISVNIGAAETHRFVECYVGTWASHEQASDALRTLCGQGYKKDEKFRTPSFESVDAMKIRAKQIRAGQR